MSLPCVILAGGRGTRMESFTAQIPKALIPVCGKPFVHYQLTHLAKTGVSDVIFCIGYKGNQIQDYVKDGSAWGLRVRYVDEEASLQGTAGALRLALEKGLLDSSFLVTYGDALLPIDFSAVWRYFQNRTEPILMTLFRNENRGEPSNIIFDGKKVVLYAKGAVASKDPAMQFLDYGALAMRRAVVEADVPGGPLDLADVLKKRSQQGNIAGREVKTPYYSVGSPEALRELTRYIDQHGEGG